MWSPNKNYLVFPFDQEGYKVSSSDNFPVPLHLEQATFSRLGKKINPVPLHVGHIFSI